ncbi:DUF1963 domain-containing protein [Micromonospora sp. Llam0]|uniref:DUF1963 domain-containing protein n=1 Tax=Micromonospora sp. Llam0 TaxID=2485143 RepID=UPI00351A37B3
MITHGARVNKAPGSAAKRVSRSASRRRRGSRPDVLRCAHPVTAAVRTDRGASVAVLALVPPWCAMDHQGQFRHAAIALGIPDDEVSRFTEHLRLSIRLSGGSGGVPVGQFGGLPRLPVGMDWPSDGVGPLPFIFSVDCAALPRVDGFGLPAAGSLLFFLAHEQAAATGERRYGRVVFVPAGTDTEVAAGSTGHAIVGEQYDVSATLRAERLPRRVRRRRGGQVDRGADPRVAGEDRRDRRPGREVVFPCGEGDAPADE